jgi:transmembrane sensor
MSLWRQKSDARPSKRAVRGAAEQLTELHSDDRSERTVEQHRRWLREKPDHQAAFDAATEMWELAGRLKRPAPSAPQRHPRAPMQFVWASAAVAACIVLGIAIYFHTGKVTTALGEQRTLVLDDGSRVFLNTDTQVRVRFTDQQRRVDLVRGEALFEVAKRGASWPFVVAAGGQEITALATSFLVRRDAHQTSVTLVDGRVAVAPMEAPDTRWPSAQERTLEPGERLTFAANALPKLDHPPIDAVKAWRMGRIDFRATPLADAVDEMNRYSRIKLRIERPEAAAVLVRASFRAGDSESFSRAMQALCNLKIAEKGQEIWLMGIPAQSCR